MKSLKTGVSVKWNPFPQMSSIELGHYQVAERKSAAAASSASSRRASTGNSSGSGASRATGGGAESRLVPEHPSPPITLLTAGGGGGSIGLGGGFPSAVERSPPFADFNPYGQLEVKQEDDAVSLGSGSATSEEYRELEIIHALRSQQQHQFYLKQQQQQQQQQQHQQQQRFTGAYPPYPAAAAEVALPSRLLPPTPSSTMTSTGQSPPPPTLVPPPPFQRPYLRPQMSHPPSSSSSAAASNNFQRSHSNGHSLLEDMDLDVLEDMEDVKPPTVLAPLPEVKPSVSEALIAGRSDWRNFDLFLRAQAAWRAAAEENAPDENLRKGIMNLLWDLLQNKSQNSSKLSGYICKGILQEFAKYEN